MMTHALRYLAALLAACAAAGWLAAHEVPAGGQSVLDELQAVEEIRSVLVLDGERVLVEWYRTPAAAGPTNIKSASKSLLSALVGIALERGLVDSLDTPVVELLPHYAELLAEAPRSAITLRHALSMTTGLESTSGDAYGAWVAGEDWVAGALARPLVSPPGDAFLYSTGSSHLVAAILDHAVGPPGLAAWAQEVAFGPAGITVAAWQKSPEGVPFGGNNMSMTPRDLARFGRLYLARGELDGRPIVPASWVEASTRRHAAGWPERYGAYGLGWWLPHGDAILAVGYGGQFLWIDPANEKVVVVTSTSPGKGAAWDRRVLTLIRRLAAGVGGR